VADWRVRGWRGGGAGCLHELRCKLQPLESERGAVGAPQHLHVKSSQAVSGTCAARHSARLPSRRRRRRRRTFGCGAAAEVRARGLQGGFLNRLHAGDSQGRASLTSLLSPQSGGRSAALCRLWSCTAVTVLPRQGKAGEAGAPPSRDLRTNHSCQAACNAGRKFQRELQQPHTQR
jgi:hypothetical protein